MKGNIGDRQRLHHILVHEYFGIDFDLNWQVIIDDLPQLKNKILKALENIPG